MRSTGFWTAVFLILSLTEPKLASAQSPSFKFIADSTHSNSLDIAIETELQGNNISSGSADDDSDPAEAVVEISDDDELAQWLGSGLLGVVPYGTQTLSLSGITQVAISPYQFLSFNEATSSFESEYNAIIARTEESTTDDFTILGEFQMEWQDTGATTIDRNLNVSVYVGSTPVFTAFTSGGWIQAFYYFNGDFYWDNFEIDAEDDLLYFVFDRDLSFDDNHVHVVVDSDSTANANNSDDDISDSVEFALNLQVLDN